MTSSSRWPHGRGAGRHGWLGVPILAGDQVGIHGRRRCATMALTALRGGAIVNSQHVRGAERIGVSDERILSALASIDRARFVPRGSEHESDLDAPVRIARGQTTSQPSLVARMIDVLELTGDEHVLEVGTGLGYQAALLSRLAAHVTTVERFDDLAEDARRNLADAGIDNVEVVLGDGTKGCEEHAPYDAIIVAAAFTEVPPPLVEQLREGGRLVQPVGPGGREQIVVFRRDADGLQRLETVVGARFVRLVGEHGFREDDR